MKVFLFANTDWYLYNFRLSLISALRDTGHDVLLISPDGPYGERLRKLGFQWIPAPMARQSLNPIREILLLSWLCAIIYREKPEIVHGFTIKCAIYGSLASRLSWRAEASPRRVNSVAGMGYVFTSNDLKARLLRPIVRTLFRLTLGGSRTRLILQNPDDAALFEKQGLIDPSTVRLIRGSGVDCRRFHPPTSRRREHRLRVLLPARLLWDKGLAEFVRSAEILKPDAAPVEFLLAGEPDPGNPAAVPESTVRAWERQGLVTWLGHVEDMPALLQSVDVVVLPSYREGLPKGLIEAAACGVPLITTDVPGCREVVKDGVEGIVVPVRDANSLAQAIRKLRDDPPLRARLGLAARVRAVSEFDQAIVVEQTLTVYRELLDSACGGTSVFTSKGASSLGGGHNRPHRR